MIEIRDTEIPSPKPDQVLVKFTHSGVCHSDLHLMQLDWPWLSEAIVPGRVGGHEGVGTIEKLGTEVKGLKLGQKVHLKFRFHWCIDHLRLVSSGLPELA